MRGRICLSGLLLLLAFTPALAGVEAQKGPNQDWNGDGKVTFADALLFAKAYEAADFDGDGTVGFSDFILLARAYGSTQTRFDLNGDGRVDFPDFVIFAQMYAWTGSSMNVLYQLHDLGVPVHSVNWVRLVAGADGQGRPCIYVTMGQQGDNLFVLQVNPDTGTFQQFTAGGAGSNYPTATLMSRSGMLYIGAAYSGHLFRFDPAKNMLEDLGAINPKAATFPCQIDEDAQGQIWIGSYPTADLTRYDPGSGTFTHYGRMDSVDMYNYPLVNRDGTVACLIRQTKPHVVVLNPTTKQKQVVGPVVTQGQGTVSLRKGTDGYLYILSSEGNYRLQGMQATPVSSVPAAASLPGLPDKSTFSFADASSFLYRKLQVRHTDGTVQTFDLDYKASGSDIFCLAAGPDGKIYGSSVLPEHLFRYDPSDSSMTDMGKCSASGGEAYSMGDLDGKLYIASYPAARISVYDPSLPYQYGTQAGSNPLELGRVDDISYRPRSMLTGPLGRVWLASLPDYGMWGGPLSYYDPKTGLMNAYYRIVGDASCYTLASLEKGKLIAVGTSISGGSGTQPKVSQAELFLWDPIAEKKVWEGAPGWPVTEINALVAGPDGRLYGTARGSEGSDLFVFDPDTETFTNRIPVPDGGALDNGLQLGPDGMLYGISSSALYRLEPGSLTVDVLAQESGGFSVPGPILEDRIYFAKGDTLRSARLF